jgi:hypothetical protein
MASIVPAESIAMECIAPTITEPTDESVKMEDAPKVRTKLHLYAILTALFVGSAVLRHKCRC